ncbi:uncharacterized protein METZ01_LOCUS54333, partial [marine metagenome]
VADTKLSESLKISPVTVEHDSGPVVLGNRCQKRTLANLLDNLTPIHTPQEN